MSPAASAHETALSNALPPGPIKGSAAWYGRDMADDSRWIYRLNADEIGEIETALTEFGRQDTDLTQVTRETFQLPTLGAALDRIRHELLSGRGFILIRGIPMEGRSVADAAAIFWGLGSYLGKAVSQNGKGHVLGHVRDLGYDVDDPNARVYQTDRRQFYHADSCDIVGLMCLKKAQSGGLSSIISSTTLYNEMMARDPGLAAELFRPFKVDRRGEVPAGMDPYFSVPIMNWFGGRLTCYYVRRYIESAQRFGDVAPLTERQIQALDLFDAIAEENDVHLNMDFEPGDLQFLHNHQILHDRTDYVDWDDPDRKRHLLRLWLCPPDGRPLPPSFAARYGGVEAGNRGGIMTPGVQLHAPLVPA